MRSTLIGMLVGALLGAAGGFAAGLLAFPFLFPPAPAHAAPSAVGTGPALATGGFVHADPADPLHWGTGTVTVYPGLIRLGEDFEVGPGPKYHLYLVPARGIGPDSRVEETMFVDLGPLKAFRGAQGYEVPTGVDLHDFGSLVVWCEQLNVLISAAELRLQ